MSVRSRIYPFLSILFRPVSLFPLPPSPPHLLTEKFTFFRENGLSSNSRSTSLARVSVCTMYTCVCACVCASIRMQQRPRQVNMTVGTKQRELVRANVKWPTFLAVNSIPSTPFVHRPLFRLLTRLIRPFSFSFILLFLPQLSPTTFSPSSSVRVARPRCRLPGRDSKRFTRGFSRGIQTKINRTTKGRVVHLVQVCREENQRTLMREVIDCRFLSFKG